MQLPVSIAMLRESEAVEPRERVGVLLVHGIGQQLAFEHLESGAIQLVQALRDLHRGKRVTTTVNTTSDAPYRASQETWSAEGRAPVSIDLKDKNTGDVLRFDLREVWWADLGEDASPMVFLSFLWWGCSLWFRRSYREAPQPGFNRMCRPRDRSESVPEIGREDLASPRPGAFDRLQLFFFACLFVLVWPTWYLLGLLLKTLRIATFPSAGILVRYIGDVKLYGQRRRGDQWPLADIGTPPRFMIRRRFFRAMIDVATGPYDRWYIFGHSLGSVIAFNALMEPEHSLPNYLDRERWDKARDAGFTAKTRFSNVDEMCPTRPSWLGHDDAIDRRKLFAKFRGLLTYGSPLDKFAVLFPATVPLNRERGVFPEDCEWINIYEPSDPVAGRLESFGPFANDDRPTLNGKALSPSNYSIACWPIALWSHVTYFVRPRPFSRPTAVLHAVQRWLVDASDFQSALSDTKGTQLTQKKEIARSVSKWLQIAGFAVVTLLVFAGLCNWLLPDAVSYLPWLGDGLDWVEFYAIPEWLGVSPYWAWVIGALVFVVAAVSILGVIRRIFEKDDEFSRRSSIP